MKQKKNTALICTLIMSIVGIIVFASIICFDLITRRQGTAFYATLPASFNTPIGQAPSPVPTPPPAQSEPEIIDYEEIEPIYNEVEEQIQVIDFNDLRNKCPDAVAWIRINGSVIDYPMVQGSDNEFYLNHLPNKDKNKIGSIFVDYRNSPDFSDQMTLVYGHYMKTGDMFASLKQYESNSYYEEHPTAYIFIPDTNFVLELFAGYIVDSAKEQPPFHFNSDTEFESYVKNIKSRSIFKSDVNPEPSDRLVCLVTCNYSVENGRLIIVGKLSALE